MTLWQKIKYFFIRKITKFIVHLIAWSSSKKVYGQEHLENLRKNKTPIIYVIWHRHIFFSLFRFKNSGVHPLISLSDDGELVAQIAREFGTFPIRGSSSKGGGMAFLKLYRSIKREGAEIFITADGPKGPAREIKDGTLLLARKTQAALVPVSWFGSRVKIFEKTWDKFMIPKFFGRIIFEYGTPIFVPAECSEDQMNQAKGQVKKALDDLENKIAGNNFLSQVEK